MLTAIPTSEPEPRGASDSRPSTLRSRNEPDPLGPQNVPRYGCCAGVQAVDVYLSLDRIDERAETVRLAIRKSQAGDSISSEPVSPACEPPTRPG